MMTPLKSIFTGRDNAKPSTQPCELLGLFGMFVWFFCSMYSYEKTLFSSHVYIPIFLLALFGSLLGFGLYCKRDMTRLSRFTKILTPIGILCTVVMYLLPLSGFVCTSFPVYVWVRCFCGASMARWRWAVKNASKLIFRLLH